MNDWGDITDQEGSLHHLDLLSPPSFSSPREEQIDSNDSVPRTIKKTSRVNSEKRTRDRAKSKEKRRRSSINQKLDELRDILPQKGLLVGNLTSRSACERVDRFTKEQILAEARSYISQLEEELENLKRGRFEQSTNQVSRNVMPFSKEDLKTAFIVMLNECIPNLFSNHKRFRNFCLELNELAEKIGEPTFKATCKFSWGMYYSQVEVLPEKQLEYVEEALGYPPESLQVELFGIASLRGLLQCEQAVCLAALGQLDKLAKLEKEILHEADPRTEQTMNGGRMSVRYLSGDLISLSEAMLASSNSKGVFPILGDFADAALAMALIQAGQLQEGVEIFNRLNQTWKEDWGVDASLYFAVGYLWADLKAKEWEKGLERWERVFQHSQEMSVGPFGSGELYRLKGEFLSGLASELKDKKDNPEHVRRYVQEAEKIFQESFYMSGEARMRTMQLKAALSWVTLAQTFPLLTQRETAFQSLRHVYNILLPFAKHNQSQDISLAHQLVQSHGY